MALRGVVHVGWTNLGHSETFVSCNQMPVGGAITRGTLDRRFLLGPIRELRIDVMDLLTKHVHATVSLHPTDDSEIEVYALNLTVPPGDCLHVTMDADETDEVVVFDGGFPIPPVSLVLDIHDAVPEPA